MTTERKSAVMLLITAMIWGFAFVAQSVGMDHIGPYTFMALRYTIGSLVMIPLIKIIDKNKTKEIIKEENRNMIKPGILLGLSLFLGSLFQQLGLLSTTAAKAGFITTLYIVIVPLCGIFMHKKVGKNIFVSVVLAVVGLYLLCMNESFTLSKGDFLELIGAFAFAAQIIFADSFTHNVDPIRLSFMQYFVSAICSTILMLLFEEVSFSAILLAIVPILYSGICSSGIANTLQLVGQKGIDATIASLIMSLESVFAAVAGALILHQLLSMKELCGCILMFIAIIIAQLPKKEA